MLITNFDAYETIGKEFKNRFPNDVNGIENWNNFIEGQYQNEFSILSISPISPSIPQVFISHKKEDRDYALRIAKLCNDNGFRYWLDVLNPNLDAVNSKSTLTQQQRSFITAAIIEMGLLNSTHIIAAITPKSKASKWIPYEFGRAKNTSVLSSQAASWIMPNKNIQIEPYHDLCVQTSSEQDINAWLSTEKLNWQKNKCTILSRILWYGPTTKLLP